MKPFVALIAGHFHGEAPALAASLEEAGHQAVQAWEVMAAVQACVEHPVDVVLADVELGDGGKALLSHLKAEGGPRHVPLVFVAAGEAERLALLAAGADDAWPHLPSGEELAARLGQHVAVRRRIGALLDAAEAMQATSIADGVTGLANQRYFTERLKQEFRRAQRYDDPLSLVMLKVDHFKQGGDDAAQALRDEVLAAIAAAIRDAVRETDFVARYDGEAFALLLPNTHLAGALTVAERVSLDLHGLRFGPQKVLGVSASFGVSSFPGRAVTSAEALVATAREALGRATEAGRGRISLHHGPPAPAAP